VNRGGCWSFEAADCRSAYRSRSGPSLGYYYSGFRVALISSGLPKSPEPK